MLKIWTANFHLFYVPTLLHGGSFPHVVCNSAVCKPIFCRAYFSLEILISLHVKEENKEEEKRNKQQKLSWSCFECVFTTDFKIFNSTKPASHANFMT